MIAHSYSPLARLGFVHRRWAVMTAVVLGLLLALTLGATARADDSAVKVRVVPRTGSVAQGGQLVIAVEMDFGTKYHAWPAADVKLPANIEEFAIRTVIGPSLDDGGKPKLPAWISAFDGVQYPETHKGKVADPSGEKPTIELPLYSGKAVTFLRFSVADGVPVGEQILEISISYQACDESMCLPPEDLTLPVKVVVVAKGAADLGAENEPSLFKGFDASKWGSGAVVIVPAPVTPPQAVPQTPIDSSSVPAPSFVGFALSGGIAVLFFFAVIGGFVLNLTPCVLPVVPIKIITLSKHATSRRQAIILGIWMAIGVVVFWTVIGLPMAFVSSNLDPSRFIFGIWWVTLTIGVVIAGLGFGIMGLFNITLPQTVYAISPKVDTAWGSFVFGVMTAVLGLPCFGFVAGGLLAGTATLGAAKIMAIFFGLGVGMAAPYLVLSVWPQMLKFIPKTGPASELVKQVMGLLLLAAAAFFVAAGIKALLSEMPYLRESISWWAVAFFVLLASVWMVVRTYQITVKPFARAFMPLLAIAMVGGIVFIAAGLASTAREDYEKRERAISAAGGGGQSVLVTGAWIPYTPELLEKAIAAGKIVVVDFTADWCINCKFLKTTVLDRDPVRAAMTQGDRVVLLEVDLTSRKAPGWKYLESLGQTGIPTLAIYGPGLPKPILLNAYTPDTVITAMGKAAGDKPLAASSKK